MRGSTLTLKLPRGFNLPRAVCSYGYFLLAPNRWEAGERALYRPLRGGRDRVLDTVITQPRADRLRIRCRQRLGPGEAALLRDQVTRMLRLDEDFSTWRRLHPVARRARFDRLFRSPTLFEDLVKTITTCNVTWPNTLRMNALLCRHVGGGAFPTPAQLAAIRPDALQRQCKVGYRAGRIVRLARLVVRGKLDLARFEESTRSTEEIFRALREIYGIGDYAAGNLCQLLGRYDRLAIDSETYRHFRQEHGLPTPKVPGRLHARIERHYAPFAPYQFLAYWFELWTCYQRRFGKAHAWDAQVHGSQFTAAVLRQPASPVRQAPVR